MNLPLKKKKVLAAFLEKDNLKFILFTGSTRTFAGQITFTPEVVRDGFIADADKFGSQVKVAYAQKVALHEASEIVLYVSPDKAFTKTLPATDSIDSFVHGLPYFKEELMINQQVNKDKTITYVGFEKKLIEDLQRPFLDMGKKILAVKSPANVLVTRYPQVGKYILLASMDKDIVILVAENGIIVDLTVVRNEVFAARFPEYQASHNLVGNSVYVVGIFPSNLLSNLNLQIVSLAQSDIYDLLYNSSLPKKLNMKIPDINERYLYLGGAIIVGVILVVLVVKNLDGIKSIAKPIEKKAVSPVTPPAPVAVEPEPILSDYPVAIYNGTSVSGEAGRLAEKIKGLGFTITETKNATTAGFVVTRLRVTKSTPTKISNTLKNLLLESYESVNLETVATFSGTAKVEVIIGKKK
ncbi:LytR C-terminal domain-containing protein [Candidatus Microgenomates bacterium]|nr:LytR C-terminal domain-containing protein [Candidatus Microgenomates bacterium]